MIIRSRGIESKKRNPLVEKHSSPPGTLQGDGPPIIPIERAMAIQTRSDSRIENNMSI